jgi:hypothetical protein
MQRRRSRLRRMTVYRENLMEQLTEEDYLDFRARKIAAQERFRDRRRAEKNRGSECYDFPLYPCAGVWLTSSYRDAQSLQLTRKPY